MESSVKRNLGYQTIYQILNIILPLITAPYLARVLGATQLGVFSYTTSVVAYFTLVAMLGTVNYGTRSIASVKEDKETRSRVFCEIYCLQVLSSVVAIIAYLIYVVFICKENYFVSTIQIITLIGALFDISWLFFGMENFKIIVTTSMVFRLATFFSILIFVKSSDDLWIYAGLMVVGVLFSQLVVCISALKYIKIVRVSLSGIWKHIKPNLLLFVPLLAMSIYHTMDKTMLGILSDYQQCGFYYNADKIINIPLCIINGVGTVMLPRMTTLYNQGKRREGDRVFIVSMEGVAVVSIAMAVGIAAISKEFVPLFLGEGYESCVFLIIMLSPVLIIKGLSNTTRTQYLVPLNLEGIFIKSVIAGAITNLLLNIALIPRIGAIGAVIGTLFAELISCVWQFISIKKVIDLKKCFANCSMYLIPGTVMFLLVRWSATFQISTPIKLLLEIGVGEIAFVVICFILWKIQKNDMYKIVFGSFLSKIPLEF